VNQTFKPFEVIVVDDCSTDNTVEVVNSFPDPMVRCIVLERNSGAQAARNRGIREARGEWIAFQDSDDEWLPDKLEKQVLALAKVDFDPMTVVHADCYRHEHQSDERTLWELPFVHGKDVFCQLLKSPGPVFPTILTSKAALEAIGYLDEKVPSYQEWDTSIRLARLCRFIHIRESLFIYHLHTGETISKNLKRDVEGYQYLVDKFRDDILEQLGPATLNAHLANNAIKAMRYGYFPRAGEILSKSVGKSAKIAFLKRRAQASSYPSIFVRIDNLLRCIVAIFRNIIK
jgi:glycosyltransferase involved in cell wall biosynthesis